MARNLPQLAKCITNSPRRRSNLNRRSISSAACSCLIFSQTTHMHSFYINFKFIIQDVKPNFEAENTFLYSYPPTELSKKSVVHLTAIISQ